MIVTAVLVSHDGSRWLPAVLDALAGQTRPADRVVALDTSSRDDSAGMLRAQLGDGAVHTAPRSTGYPQAVAQALAQVPPVGPEEWVWLLHDDSSPAPQALEQLLAAAVAHPEAEILGPKLREWPSLRRLLEVGLTISGTGQRETGLETGEYDQGQHDQVRRVLAVNTAGMLVRRSVLRDLGGFDEALPIFGNDIDFGWRAAQAGHTTLVVPAAVVFHAEAASRGARRTSLTGRHVHFAQRRAALFTMLANAPSRMLVWQYVRLFFGSLLRAVGFLLLRSVGEALDEVAAVFAVHGRPRQIAAARAARAHRRNGAAPNDVRALLAPRWMPYRHGLDTVEQVISAATHQASDVAERRRAAKALTTTGSRSRSAPPAGPDPDDEDAYYADSGAVVRFLTNPVAMVMTAAVLLSLFAAREAVGEIVSTVLSPVPGAASDWWQLHVASWHPLGTGTDVPAPAYLLPFAVAATMLPGGTATVISALMLLAVPIGAWGAWRLLRVLGHLADPSGLPRWLLVWGSVTYALVPATSGAWGAGRFGAVALAALLPWLAHAALGFADPEPDRRWRAAWRTALITALCAAFVPAVWVFGVVATALVLGAAAAIAPGALRQRNAWGPPALAMAVVPVLLAPWLVPLVTTGSAAGLLLEAGALPEDSVTFHTLLAGRLGEFGAPWWWGAVLGALALIALLPRRTRVPVLACWLVALAAAVATGVLSRITLHLPAVDARPGLALFVIVLSGLAVVAVVLGADTFITALAATRPLWQRAAAMLMVLVAASVPLGGLVWWLSGPETDLGPRPEAVVPAYMLQSSEQGDEHGVLVLTGDLETGVDYRIRRGDGTTLGEDEILQLADEDVALTEDVRELASAPTEQVVTDLGARGIEYVVLAAPADPRIAAGLDGTSGLVQASAQDRSTRAWRVDQALAPDAVAGPDSWLRPVLLVGQGVAIVLAMVLAAPTLRRRRR